MEQITPIRPLGQITGADGGTGPVQPAGQRTFGQVFQSAIDNVKQTDADKVEAQYLLATGQLDNPSALMIAASKNELAVSLLVQLRNKALDAYSELMRISL